ncbi:hypothetical protein DUY81_07025 [Acidipropionibacterium acidipropionici]|uniref:Uncharacterized protein n=1 Tax=Acidipropionibacterium acidipropionici TaxID=1748 RepID=A0AAC9AN87_9ACTN|nr:hypothetical protein [Acidipropionibacterium acidipropionici]AMS04887.1 hypothetical protein AXH35_04760 [Acidipropionibacterium acidipropionici]AOZ46371.1 hypothetical protein A8L58_06225 [Acidipropionibacterium acidipropionici]AZP37587.1 hypothetical protein DUY81_07025 [Acidipropionibacterium acidipropionici]
MTEDLWDRTILSLTTDGDGWPVAATSTAAGRVVVDAPRPWRPVDLECSARELEVTAEHPDGARMRIRYTIEETWDIHITVRATGDRAISVPGPRWRFLTDIPVHAWPAGADGVVATAARQGGQMEWKQLAGDSRMGDDGVLPLGRMLALGPGESLASSWRGHEAACPVQLLHDLPDWLPGELIVDEGDEIWCDTPDAGLMLDGAETDGQVLTGRAGLHELEVRQARGTTRPAVGWAPSLASVRRIRGEEIMGSLDVRRADGARLWILARAAEAADVDRVALEMVDESLENLLSRPGAGLFTVLTALTRSSTTADMDIWNLALEALAVLDDARPGTLMAHALAASLARISGGPEPAPVDLTADAEDPLVRAERGMLLDPGPRPDPDSLSALWLLGGVLPSPAPGPLLDGHGRHPALRTAQTVALTSMWPEWWDVSADWGVDAATLRQRAVRRLLAQDHLDDEALALLMW